MTSFGGGGLRNSLYAINCTWVDFQISVGRYPFHKESDHMTPNERRQPDRPF